MKTHIHTGDVADIVDAPRRSKPPAAPPDSYHRAAADMTKFYRGCAFTFEGTLPCQLCPSPVFCEKQGVCRKRREAGLD